MSRLTDIGVSVTLRSTLAKAKDHVGVAAIVCLPSGGQIGACFGTLLLPLPTVRRWGAFFWEGRDAHLN